MAARQAFSRAVEVAHAHHQGGRHSQAEAAYLDLIHSAPKEPLIHNLLGLLYLQTGRPESAAKHIRKALTLRPEDSAARYNLALALKDCKRLDEAVTQLEILLERTPEHIEALNALGNLQRLRGREEHALAVLERASKRSPDHPGILLNLGLAYLAQKRIEEAANCLRKAVEVAPSANAFNHLGAALNAKGDDAAAVSAFRNALELDGRQRDAWINLAITLEQTGQFEAAEKVLRDALQKLPNFGAAYFQLMQLSRREASDEDIRAMQGASRQGDLSDTDLELINYGLGHAFHKRKEFSSAFNAFQAAHRIRAKAAKFDLTAHLRRIDLLEREFSEIRPLDMDHPELVYIVGMPRSGTSLTEQILASHSRVSALGELPVMGGLAEDIAGRSGAPFPHGLSQLAPKELLQLATKCRDQYMKRGGHGTIIDTTPSNYLLVGLIARVFPSAKIVHCHRHPLDVCLSIYQYPLSDAHAYAHDLSALGHTYAAHQRLTRHWQALIGLRFYELRYEDLVAHPTDEIRKLLGFCGLEFESACLEFHKHSRRVRTPSANQVRRPIHQTSVGRSKPYAPYLQPLINVLGAAAG